MDRRGLVGASLLARVYALSAMERLFASKPAPTGRRAQRGSAAPMPRGSEAALTVFVLRSQITTCMLP